MKLTVTEKTFATATQTHNQKPKLPCISAYK